jgi:3',5'-cyclic AMP phosphodiesterase CpdA
MSVIMPGAPMGAKALSCTVLKSPLRFGDQWFTSRLKQFETIQPDLFVPRPLTPATKRFVIIGDPGSGSKAQRQIAEQMAELFEHKPFASAFVLGDNVYENGEPELFKERLYEPYKKLFQRDVRFFPVLGNHDVRKGFGEQQLNFWGTPNYYNVKIGDVEFFAMDTTVFLPGFDGCYKTNPGLAQKKAEIQYQWLDKVLSESTAKTKVVLGHYPLYSSGVHGTFEPYYFELQKKLEPLFVKHGVNLYLSGHEHHYERTKPIQGIRYIVSGAAGKLSKFFNPLYPFPQEKVALKYHFMLFEIQDDGSLKFETIDKKGRILDSGKI